ncbi:MAG: family 78 glycoside hydrolase catalytic domain [Clostridia bacterium]|nr:family 78 glycoside hydrolase catalytic domain [Clostridia bacterium]
MNWIHSPKDTGEQAVIFQKEIRWKKRPVKVVAQVTAIGIYNLMINGQKVGKQVLTPGWTSYRHRVQVQTYDVTDLMFKGGLAEIEVGRGWAVGTIGFTHTDHIYDDLVRAAAEITAYYEDGESETVVTDSAWDCYTHPVLYTDIYNGEVWDGTHRPAYLGKAAVSEKTYHTIPQVGEDIVTHERLKPIEVITTPKGETVLDFGQNMTGWVELTVAGAKGAVIAFDHAEVLDQDGNFYNENYRSAKAYAKFILGGNEETLAPHFTFYGFRYIRLLEYPFKKVNPAQFTAVVVHSELKRTGDFHCGHELINQLYHNVIWGQKSNYLDIPTDCPQRDERLGWTGDAQVFCRTAAINYDVEKFFKKWLGDLALEQGEDGSVAGIVPTCLKGRGTRISAAWGDAACICPWEMYLAYGNLELLRDQFASMKKWVDYIHGAGSEEFLWLDGFHYGDWLGMDAGDGIYMGATPEDLIGTAFFAHSCSLVVKAGRVLGEDVTEYEALYRNVVAKFRECYIENGKPVIKGDALKNQYNAEKHPVVNPDTQTARVLMLHFNLCTEEDRPVIAKELAEMIEANGTHLTTGFVGTPYLLHVLAENGYEKLAYDLLLQETFPSWLFSVKQGATTMWEHWDGIKEDGTFWSKNMNSYNHYAYGAVYDWIFGVAAGIKVKEEGAGYKKITLKPVPDQRLGHLTASLETRCGKLLSHWNYRPDGRLIYRFEIPAGCEAELVLPDGRRELLTAGIYQY